MTEYRLKEPFEAALSGGPDDALTMMVTEIRPFDGDQAVMSRHGEGYYRLSDDVHPVTGMVIARWTAHPDARFPWKVSLAVN